MESLRSPLEISTLFFALSIGFYIFLYWRSQVAERRIEREIQALKPKRPSQPVMTARRMSESRALGEITISRVFDRDEDHDQYTTH